MAPNYIESKPIGTDLLTELPSLLTSNAIAFRQNVEKHSYWTDSSGVSAGDMRFSDGSFGPGAARAFFDVNSNVSSQISATKPMSGRLYIASDTSRLYAYTSDRTLPVGGARAIVYRTSAATIQSNVRVLVQVGTQTNVTTSTQTITFPTAYSVAPNIQTTVFSNVTTDYAIAEIMGSRTTCFGLSVTTLFGTAVSAWTVMWRSHGTVAL